jgi:hypothetical protein
MVLPGLAAGVLDLALGFDRQHAVLHRDVDFVTLEAR